MVYRIGCDADVGCCVVRQDRMATVRIAYSAGKIAARDIHFDPVASAESMMDIAQANRQLIGLAGSQMLGTRRGIAIGRSCHSIHQQHRATIRMQLNQLCDEISIRTVRLNM